MTSARELAFNLLQALETGTRHSDSLLHDMLRKSALSRTDRAFATSLVNGVLRYRLQLDFVISRFYSHNLQKAAPAIRNILRLGAWQLLFLDRVPAWAIVNESVRLARRFKGERMAKLVNAVLRKISPETVHLEEWLKGMEPAARLAVLHSHPEELVSQWITAYGEETAESMLRYDNESPWFGFRLNSLKTDLNRFFNEADTREVTRIESGLREIFLSQEFSPFEAPLRSGLLSVQNPTQLLACLLLNPVPGSEVLDMCAAPGGKAAALCELMGNEGHLTTLDIYEQKTAKIQRLAETLGISIITARTADARTFTPPTPSNSILLDAPCTGTGVLGRRTELRWKLSSEKLEELLKLQGELLEQAAQLLKEGGTLVYATCSVDPRENNLQTEAFLQRHPEFSPDSRPGLIPPEFAAEMSPDGSLLTLPGERPGFDGGFCHRMVKNSG